MMTKAKLQVVGFVVVSGFLVVAHADESASSAVGSRVRVRAPGSGPLVGTLSAVDDAYLTVVRSDDDAARVIARRDVTRLERSVRPSRKRKGALLGFAIGFGVGFGAAALAGNCSETPNVVDNCADPVWSSLYGVAAGAAGAGIGALVAPGERWAELPLDPRPSGPGANDVVLRVVPLVGPSRGAVMSVSW